MESKNKQPDSGTFERVAEMRQKIAYLRSGQADETWKRQFDAEVDQEIRNGHDGAMRDLLWKAMLELSNIWIFLSGLSPEERVEKIDRLIGLLDGMEPPAGWLPDFERVFTEDRRRREEGNDCVQDRLFDLAHAADRWSIRLDPRKVRRKPPPREGFNEHEHYRSVSGKWRIPRRERRERQEIGYPLGIPTKKG